MNTQTAALNAAQALVTLTQQYVSLQNNTASFMADYNQNVWDTFWQLLPTIGQASSGTVAGYDLTAGTGTVAVTNNQTLFTFSASQTALIGSYVAITGDTTNALYLIVAGSGTTWVAASPYGGQTAGTAAWGTATPNLANKICLPTGSPILVSRSSLINGVAMFQLFQTFGSQIGGTLTLPAQANNKTAYLITG